MTAGRRIEDGGLTMTVPSHDVVDAARELLLRAGLLPSSYSIVTEDGISIVVSTGRRVSTARAEAMSAALASIPHRTRPGRIGILYRADEPS